MAEQNTEGGKAFPLNLQTLLVLLTLASSVWLVSQKLTSTRPAALVGMGRDAPGEQKKEARLWEDPFKTPERHSKDKGAPVEEADLSVANLATQIETSRDQCTNGGNGWILPVMIPGSPYSEAQESRIRSRFAVVSALGEQGYVPEDPEHIGSVLLQWPTTQELTLLKKEAKELTSFKELYPMFVNHTAAQPDLRYDLDLRYEWYRPKN